MKRCVLQSDKVCNDCGACDDRCQLDPNKICDNCFRCLEEDTRAFANIPISGVFFDGDYSGERGDRFSQDFEDGFMLDSDESWKDAPLFTVRTLELTYGVRKRRKFKKD